MKTSQTTVFPVETFGPEDLDRQTGIRQPTVDNIESYDPHKCRSYGSILRTFGIISGYDGRLVSFLGFDKIAAMAGGLSSLDWRDALAASDKLRLGEFHDSVVMGFD